MTNYNDVQHEKQESATLINLNFGFYQCPDAVLKAKGLSWRAKCIYSRLLCYARQQDTCFPGHARLAVDLGKSVDTIQRGLRELRDYGLVTWKRRGLTKTNVYTIVELSKVPAFKNDVLPKPQKRGVQNVQECGLLKPQNCGTNDMKLKKTQIESDEDSSNSSQKGMDESTPTCSHVAHGTIRNSGERTEKAPSETVSHRRTETPTPHTNPSPPNRSASSKVEAPPSEGAGRPQQSLKGKDEVRRERERTQPEPPRMTAPPLTQEDMDKRIRERIARERARAQMQKNPLPGIIRDEDWNKLEQDAPTTGRLPQTKCKPMPVYPQLQQAIENISEQLGDFHHAPSNITHADNLRRLANVSLEQLLDGISEAYYATHTACQKSRITKRDESGCLVKMAYFFAVLRQKLGLPKHPCATM